MEFRPASLSKSLSTSQIQWEKITFIDFEVSMSNKAAQAAVSQIKEMATDVKVLGSYKSANMHSVKVKLYIHIIENIT